MSIYKKINEEPLEILNQQYEKLVDNEFLSPSFLFLQFIVSVVGISIFILQPVILFVIVGLFFKNIVTYSINKINQKKLYSKFMQNFEQLDKNIIYQFIYKIELSIPNIKDTDDRIYLFRLSEKLKHHYINKKYNEFFQTLSRIQYEISEFPKNENFIEFYQNYENFKKMCYNSKEINKQ